MEILITIIEIITLLILGYLFLSGLYFLSFAIASHFYKEVEESNDYSSKRVTIIIPAYKEDEVILETAMSAKNHISFKALCDVVVVADQLKDSTIQQLIQNNITVIPVSLKKSSKSKALKMALAQMDYACHYVVVLDADNIMASNYVDHIVGMLNKGYKVVQGQRVAKNVNSHFAILDGISEAVNNAIFRSGHRVLGLSASLIGSGFAINFNLFKFLINNTSSIGGFDKELELMLLKQGVTIGYSKKAIVFDEKIQEAENFVQQRRRWLSAQWVYLFSGVAESIGGKLSLDYIDKKIQFLVPPRVLSIGISLVMSVVWGVMVLLNTTYFSVALWSMATFTVNIVAVLIVVPKKYYTKQSLYSLQSLPKGFVLMIVALFKIKNANKQFIHTRHGISK